MCEEKLAVTFPNFFYGSAYGNKPIFEILLFCVVITKVPLYTVERSGGEREASQNLQDRVLGGQQGEGRHQGHLQPYHAPPGHP
jgi:hypothetical protein